jgi:hypothetical protein
MMVIPLHRFDIDAPGVAPSASAIAVQRNMQIKG